MRLEEETTSECMPILYQSHTRTATLTIIPGQAQLSCYSIEIRQTIRRQLTCPVIWPDGTRKCVPVLNPFLTDGILLVEISVAVLL